MLFNKELPPVGESCGEGLRDEYLVVIDAALRGCRPLRLEVEREIDEGNIPVNLFYHTPILFLQICCCNATYIFPREREKTPGEYGAPCNPDAMADETPPFVGIRKQHHLQSHCAPFVSRVFPPVFLHFFPKIANCNRRVAQ